MSLMLLIKRTESQNVSSKFQQDIANREPIPPDMVSNALPKYKSLSISGEQRETLIFGQLGPLEVHTFEDEWHTCCDTPHHTQEIRLHL